MRYPFAAFHFSGERLDGVHLGAEGIVRVAQGQARDPIVGLFAWPPAGDPPRTRAEALWGSPSEKRPEALMFWEKRTAETWRWRITAGARDVLIAARFGDDRLTDLELSIASVTPR